MASVSEEILLEVKFTDDNTAKRMAEIQNALASLKEEYDEIKKSVKENGAVTADQAKAMAENKAEVKALTNEMKFYEKQLQAEAKQNELVNDSINAMRTNLGKMIAQYDALSAKERENVDVGGKLLDSINKQTKAIKDAEYATQRYQRNVGNYENAIKNALPPQLQMVNGLAETAQEAGGAIPMMKNLGMAFGNLAKQAMAFIATPIGAVITAIALVVAGLVASFKTLQKAFQRTESNGDRLKESLGKLKGIGNALLKALEPLAVWFANTFAKAIDIVINSLASMVNGLQKALDWIAKTTGSKTMQNWANGLQNITIKTAEVVNATSELATAEEKLARKQRDARKIMLEYQRQAEELRQTRDDATKSAEEQEEANRKLLELLEQQKRVEGGIQQEAINIAKKRIAVYGETTENLDALAEAETEYADVIERITGQSNEALKWQNDRLAKYKEEIYLLDEITKKVLDVNYSQPNTEKRQRFDDEEDDEDVEDISAIMIERNNMRLQYEKLGFEERLKLQQENIAIEHAQRVANGEDAIATEAWYQGEMTRVAKENADARRAYITQLANSSMSATADMIGALEELARESGASEEYMKKLAVAKIAINTATAISQGVSGAMAVPFPANIPAILATITAVISGIAQAKSALSKANVPKYATGGLVEGAGTCTSDSIPAMLSNGESVMTARATSAYSPILSAMNQSVGGAPIGASTNTRAMQQLVQQFASAVAEQPIYTSVVDINEGQSRVVQIVDKF